MSFLAGLLSTPSRLPASCLIEVGTGLEDIGDLANLVSTVEIETSREGASAGKIVIDDRRTETGVWMAADSGLFTRWAPIKITADFQTHSEEVMRGFITRLKPSYPRNGADAKLEIELMDESAALDREHQRTIWGDPAPMTDQLIIQTLISDLGLVLDPASGQGASSRSLNQDSRPIQFMRERARANGYELIFSEGTVYFGPWRLEGEAQAPMMVYAGRDTNCLSFEAEDQGQSPDAVQFDQAPASDGASPVTQTIEPDLAPLGTTPIAEEGRDVGTPSVWRISREGDETEEEITARAQGLANQHSFRLRARGELDGALYGHVLKVARLVSVDGAGTRYGGLYYVDKVNHVFNPEGYRQQFELIRNATGDDGSLGGAASALSGLF
ncbi:phage late control D family protein [Woodsholea maritima]|uniref:phage late control D family protein n=1 Tax=Woodsholea maritima TaxID=240237 RepID=UPI000382DC53|nr:hypothetical protein [Woodsholea maritima]